jgi:CobQ-like glutamine amidotransferase family enzyme
MTSSFTIVRLLPTMLGVNGSAANAEIVGASLRAMGHDVLIIDVVCPEQVPKGVDLVCVGSGSGSSVSPAASALIGLIPALASWRDSGASFFSVGTGWDLLGRQLTNAAGEVIPGAGIYPSTADHRSGRFTGEVSGRDYQGRDVAGYINQVGSSVLDEGVEPLWSVAAGGGDAPAAEGLRSGGLRATRLGGPALALNPHWCEDIVAEMLSARGLAPVATEFHSRVTEAASQARAHITRRLGVSR